MVGGWGGAASERAAAWVGGASEADLKKAEGLLETVAREPWPCARGLLAETEGYRLLRQVHRDLYLAVNQWARHAKEEGEPELSLNPAEACAEAEALMRELRPDREPGLPPPDLAALGKKLEEAAAAAKKALAGRGKWSKEGRAALQGVIRAAGAWADGAERALGRAAEGAGRALGRERPQSGSGR